MINTDRLELTVISTHDVNDVFKYVSNPHTMRYERSEFKSKTDLIKFLDYFQKNKYAYSIREIGNNRVIGHVTLSPTSPTFNNEYNLGYILHEAYQGKGYCTEACKAIIDYSFGVLKIHRIRAACNPENIASWKVMEKCGLKKEAHFKSKVCFRNDEFGNPIYTDEYVYGIINKN